MIKLSPRRAKFSLRLIYQQNKINLVSREKGKNIRKEINIIPASVKFKC